MYITLDDLLRNMPERTLMDLSNNVPGANAINEQVINQAIVDASELIDGFLHGRYTLPLATVPTMVGWFCKDIAIYRLYQNRPDGRDLPKGVTDAYHNTLKLLKTVQDGSLHLGIQETQVLQPEPGEARVRAKPKLDVEGY